MKDLSEAMAYLEQEVGSDSQIINGYIEESTETGEAPALLIATGLTRKLHVDPMYGIIRAQRSCVKTESTRADLMNLHFFV